MKKATVLLILLIYFASIVIIGFFGMKMKASDVVNYVSDIKVDVRAIDSDSYSFERIEDDESGNKVYKLTVHFIEPYIKTTEEVVEEVVTDESGKETTVKRKVEKNYMSFSFMAEVSYQNGDKENAVEEAIGYIITSNRITEGGVAKIDERGTLFCYKAGKVFEVMVSPKSSSKNGVPVIIKVYVLSK